LLFFVDDLGYGDTGFTGHPSTSTPNLDRLAYAGKRLSTWYSAAAVCSASRTALLTGRQPPRYRPCTAMVYTCIYAANSPENAPPQSRNAWGSEFPRQGRAASERNDARRPFESAGLRHTSHRSVRSITLDTHSYFELLKENGTLVSGPNIYQIVEASMRITGCHSAWTMVQALPPRALALVLMHRWLHQLGLGSDLRLHCR
jgi:hypothetical protein